MPFRLFVEMLGTSSIIDVWRIYVAPTMYIKTYFLNQCNKARFTNSEKQNNENFGCKAKVQNWVGSDQKFCSWFHSLRCYCIKEKLRYTCKTSTGCNTNHTIDDLKKWVKYLLWQKIGHSIYTKRIFKITAMKNDRVNI